MTQDVKLHNKGKSTIHGAHPDATDDKGNNRKYSFAPDTTRLFHKSEADKLRRLYPRQIVSLEDEVKKFEEETPEPKSATITIEEAEKVKEAAIAAAVEAALTAERERIAAESDAEDEKKVKAKDEKKPQKGDKE